MTDTTDKDFEELCEARDTLIELSAKPPPKEWPDFDIGEMLAIKGHYWQVVRADGGNLILMGVGTIKNLGKLKRQAMRNRRKRQRRKK
jgi:hypothetical protein